MGFNSGFKGLMGGNFACGFYVRRNSKTVSGGLFAKGV